MIKNVKKIAELVLKAGQASKAEREGSLQPAFSGPVQWPVDCTVGPGLEGAIACESTVGYVNGSQGALIYRGYDIFDLCAYSTFEEVSFLLLHGRLPTREQLVAFNARLVRYRPMPKVLRQLMTFPVETMNTMAALRMGTTLMRREYTQLEKDVTRRDARAAIGTDEDSIAMETMPMGEQQAVYEFDNEHSHKGLGLDEEAEEMFKGFDSCYHLIAGLATITAAVARIRNGQMPLEPNPELSHAANYLYMITGRVPTPVEERIMDICLILHADHGMNASTFAAVVVASTLSDMFGSVGSGIAALNGPLHGGANEQVIRMLQQIGSPENVRSWFSRVQARKEKVMGFGHRVYKTYDPRARVLGPLAHQYASDKKELGALYETALALEKEVSTTLGATKGVYPNVDFYSGLVYAALGIPIELFTPTFAVSRVSGWTARITEYLENNRLFRPRAIYTGPLNLEFVPMARRGHKARSAAKRG